MHTGSKSHGHAVTYTCVGCGTFRRIPAPPTITSGADTPPPLSASEPDNAPTAKSNEPNQDPQANRSQNRRKKKPFASRPLSLFARDVGHMVFRGNEKLDGENGSTSFTV
jgi:ribonuclease P protein subunit RPR2